MIITPKGAPAPTLQDLANTPRAKAIAAFEKTAAATQSQAPVSNPTRVAPEEMRAITSEVSGQPVTNVEETTSQVAETPVETVEAKEEAPELSKQMALLARKERAIRAKQQQAEQAIRQREAALAAREAELANKGQQFDPNQYIPKSQLKEEAIRAILTGEIPYQEITENMLNQQSIDPRMEAQLQKLQAKIDELEKQNVNSQKSQAEAQDQQYKAAVQQIRSDVQALVKSDPAYETVRATGSVNDVVELIEQTFKEDGILLSVDEATQKVEDYLVEEAMKLTRIGKIQQRLNVKPAAKQVTETQPPKDTKQTQPMKTLTNAASSSRTLSAKERAILAFKGELK